MAPYAILFFVFTVLPVAVAILLSFTSFNMLEAPKFIGIANYYKMFLNDDIFITSVKNTLIMAVLIGPGGYILSFLFAWLINELSRLMRVIFTIIFYAPSLAGGMLTIWTFFFSGDATGYVNGTLMKLGIVNEPIIFFQDEAYMIPLIIFVSLWMSLGTTFLSFIAGFQGVDKQYYEAAAIDGIRNRWQELWYITLPLLKPQLFFGAVMSITSAFGVGAVVTALCGSPSTNYAAHTVMNHITDYGSTRYEMGYACALATVLFVIMIVSNKLVQKLISHVGT
ncbi:MAG: sugar ABC transporter permease [Clostridia bacterium]|nr:sugar ABC transporter permease [Clostridia bacterium]